MRASKLIAAVVGIPMILISLAIIVGGGIAVALPDDEGWVSTGPVHLETDSAAMVGDDIEIDFGASATNGRARVSWGEIPAKIDVTGRSDKDVFIGIATEEDAAVYLAGVAHDRLTSIDDHHDVEFIPGAYQITPPAETDIWVASSVDGTLDWDIRSGEWTIVAVNADGSAGIDLDVDAAAKVSFLRPLGAALIAAGILGTGAGIALTYFGVRRERPRRVDAPQLPTIAGEPVATD